MEKILKKLKNEWEKLLLYVSILFAIFAIASLFFTVMYGEKESLTSSASLPLSTSFLNRSAFAFLNEISLSEKISDPFREKKILAKYDQPKRNENTPSSQQKIIPPPTKPKKNVSISYSGWMDSSNGERIAFVYLTDEKSKNKKSFNLSVGDVFSGFKMEKIEEGEIVISDKTGRKYKVKIHSSMRTEIE